mmetsp:Transcript_34570/g.86853  ORF Transcript_34570/g.86853 Transcript_34570/m.86853 type:complete len:254 (+) Transcript_34570:1092-1853(+)
MFAGVAAEHGKVRVEEVSAVAARWHTVIDEECGHDAERVHGAELEVLGGLALPGAVACDALLRSTAVVALVCVKVSLSHVQAVVACCECHAARGTQRGHRHSGVERVHRLVERSHALRHGERRLAWDQQPLAVVEGTHALQLLCEEVRCATCHVHVSEHLDVEWTQVVLVWFAATGSDRLGTRRRRIRNWLMRSWWIRERRTGSRRMSRLLVVGMRGSMQRRVVHVDRASDAITARERLRTSNWRIGAGGWIR